MRVLKFGGTSVSDSKSIRAVVDIVRKCRDEKLVLVSSAMGQTTDHLAAIGRSAAAGQLEESLEAAAALRDYHRGLVLELLPAGQPRWRLETLCEQFLFSLKDVCRGLSVLTDLSPAVQDRILSMGELLSTSILCEVLKHSGLPAEWVDARQLVVTDENHTCAEPLFERTAVKCRETLLPILDKGLLPVTQGYIGRSGAGAPTTLGRGGSDYTASLIGAALGAEEIQIWTDVDGILTADPSLVPEARSIPVLSFREAAELAFFGARVLHPKTLEPALERHIPVRVLNTRRPGGEGTLILAFPAPGGGAVKSIAYKEAMTLVNLVSARMFKAHGFLRRVFETLDRHGLAPDAMATSEVSVSMAFHGCPAIHALAEELRESGSVEVRGGQALVCVAGEGLKRAPGILGDVFGHLEGIRVSMVAQGGSEVALTFVVEEDDLPRTVRMLHDRFFGSAPSTALTGDAEPCGPPAVL